MDNTLNIDMLFNRFREHIKSETLVGEPMEIGGITLLPIFDISIMLGFQGGNPGQSADGGAGIGGRVATAAILVIKDRTAELIPVKSDTDLEKLLDLVPDIVDEIQARTKSNTKEDQR